MKISEVKEYMINKDHNNFEIQIVRNYINKHQLIEISVDKIEWALLSAIYDLD